MNEDLSLIRINRFNNELGSLNIIDGIECDICKNKGFIAKLDKKGYDINVECSCMKERKFIRRLQKLGLDKQIERYDINLFETKTKLEKTMLDRAKDFLQNVKGKNWLIYSGAIGSGKTHISTALIYEFVKGDFDVEILQFTSEFSRLQHSLRSNYSVKQEEAVERLERLKSVEVLFIDDFLKLDNLDNVFELLDSRYINRLITVITTEKTIDDFMNIDRALGSRIYEMTANGHYLVEAEQHDRYNYRLRSK